MFFKDVNQVLPEFLENPHTRSAENTIEISQMSVLRVLKKELFKPYKQQVVKELLPQDREICIAFAEQQLALKIATIYFTKLFYFFLIFFKLISIF